LFGTFQDRLLKELKLYKISSIKKANCYLHNKFLPKFNKKFPIPPKDLETAWGVVPKELNLDSIFCIKEQRTVRADNTIGTGVVLKREGIWGTAYIKYKDQYLNYKEIYSDETYEAKPSSNTLVLNDLIASDIGLTP
jgi:hypothetical protein